MKKILNTGKVPPNNVQTEKSKVTLFNNKTVTTSHSTSISRNKGQNIKTENIPLDERTVDNRDSIKSKIKDILKKVFVALWDAFKWELKHDTQNTITSIIDLLGGMIDDFMRI